MKHIYILLIAFIHYLPIAAQTVFPSAADQPVWHLTEGNPFGNPGQLAVFVLPDEVSLCGKTWGVAQHSYTLANGQSSAPSTIGYYRQVDQRIFFRQTSDCNDREYLMYDFSLETGDSVWVGIPGLNFYTDSVLVRVLNTSTFCSNGVERKTLWLAGYVPDLSGFFPPIEVSLQWLEGIGEIGIFSQHPFYSGTCFLDNNCEGGYRIKCMQTLFG
ncbi:MAG: hypothetical protein HUU01_10095, partial [Saprospiraceae bacterium]|nr:hypothetical protein [Saprospiraceae bacterium]